MTLLAADDMETKDTLLDIVDNDSDQLACEHGARVADIVDNMVNDDNDVVACGIVHGWHPEAPMMTPIIHKLWMRMKISIYYPLLLPCLPDPTGCIIVIIWYLHNCWWLSITTQHRCCCCVSKSTEQLIHLLVGLKLSRLKKVRQHVQSHI